MKSEGLLKLLLVGTDEELLVPLRRSLGRSFVVSSTLTASDAFALAEREGPFAVVAADLELPDGDGITLCEQLREWDRDTVCVLLTEHDNVERAVAALAKGAIFRLLFKPCSPDVMMT